MSDFQEVAQTYHRIKLLSTLSQYGKLFKVAYEMGEPIFTEEIPTAAVRIIYNNHKPITQYLFNPIFYNGLTDEERSFIIAHEALHLFFDHLSLIKEHQLNPKIANVAMDIVINETLIQGYGFNPNMEVLEQAALIHNLFDEDEIKQHNLNITSGFMVFYELLAHKCNTGQLDPDSLPQLDDHSNMVEQPSNNGNQNQLSNNTDETDNNETNHDRSCDSSTQQNHNHSTNDITDQQSQSDNQDSENHSQQSDGLSDDSMVGEGDTGGSNSEGQEQSAAAAPNSNDDTSEQGQNASSHSNSSTNSDEQGTDSPDNGMSNSQSSSEDHVESAKESQAGGKQEVGAPNFQEMREQMLKELQSALNQNGVNGDEMISKLPQQLMNGQVTDIQSIGNGVKQSLVNELRQAQSMMKPRKHYKAWQKILKLVRPNLLILKENKETEENFAQRNYGLQLLLPKNSVLPALSKIEGYDKDRIDLYFFFDTSGSCYPYRYRFAQIISEIPLNQYRLHLFNFDVVVRPIDVQIKNAHGKNPTADISTFEYESKNNNASLNILEEQIQKDLKEKRIKKYPPMVCVLTDAIAPPLTKVVPEHLDHWLFILICERDIMTQSAKSILTSQQQTPEQRLPNLLANQRQLHALIQHLNRIKSVPYDQEFMQAVLDHDLTKIAHNELHLPKKRNPAIRMIPSYFL